MDIDGIQKIIDNKSNYEITEKVINHQNSSLNRKARKKVEKILQSQEMIKKETFSERIKRIKSNQEKGKQIHLENLRLQEDELFRKKNPQLND